VFGVQDRKRSSVKKRRQDFDEKTNEHVVLIEYRVRGRGALPTTPRKAQLFAWKYTCRIEDVTSQSIVAEKPNCEEGKGQAWLDIQRAKAWCGDTDAMVELVRWRAGLSDKNDPVEAYFWCSLVEATYGWADPFQCKSVLFDRVSDEDVRKADGRVTTWEPRDCPRVLR
jgi:hypothetical protein